MKNIKLIFLTAVIFLVIPYSAAANKHSTHKTGCNNNDPQTVFISQADFSNPAKPYIIDRSGTYCLKKNIAVNYSLPIGPAEGLFIIKSDDVVIDLNRKTLQYKKGDDDKAIPGVAFFAESQKNITITNGAIKGFSTGISLTNYKKIMGKNHRIEKVKFINGRGIHIASPKDAIVRNNTFMKMSGEPIAIYYAENITVSGNIIVLPKDPRGGIVIEKLTLNPQTSSIGINLSYINRGSITKNRIKLSPGKFAKPLGIYVYGSNDVTIDKNKITGAHHGIALGLRDGTNNTISNNRINGKTHTVNNETSPTTTAGVIVSNSPNVTIKGNNINAALMYGVYLRETETGTIEANKLCSTQTPLSFDKFFGLSPYPSTMNIDPKQECN